MSNKSNVIIAQSPQKSLGNENLSLPSDDLLKAGATSRDKVDFHQAVIRAQTKLGNQYMIERLRFEIDRITAIEEVKRQWKLRGLKDG